jgi:hypothetical protein
MPTPESEETVATPLRKKRESRLKQKQIDYCGKKLDKMLKEAEVLSDEESLSDFDGDISDGYSSEKNESDSISESSDEDES